MIGYRVSQRELRRLIREHDANWLTDAKGGAAPGWGRIKDVFIRIQHYKCGYCERPMPRPQGGSREYDVEHFRPQRRVDRWPTAASVLRYPFATGGAMAGGYPWLSHDRLNYLASCKTCNQDKKRTYFPIAGQRGTAGDDVRRLNQVERPFLVNPVGAGDVRPEDLIAFVGFVAVPRGSRGHRRRRGTVMIDLFGLNLRDDLVLARCSLITVMWPCLERHRNGRGRERDDATRDLDLLTAAGSQHANCARCFQTLHSSDRAAARRYYEAARSQAERLLQGDPVQPG